MSTASTHETRRLYLDDPWLAEFESEVVAHGSLDGRATVRLRESAFYPESGGQLADRGTLDGVPVTDVQLDEAGNVHHLVDGALPAVGARVRGALDTTRRREHMGLHTGQHMLSQALLRAARARTISSRLGDGDCTIDVDVTALRSSQLEEAERIVHEVIDRDVAIRAWVPDEAELDALTLRRRPKVARSIRVVQIGEFDATPCGGTHCTRSGQVGVVYVTHTERYKGMTRVHFTAGPRARSVLLRESRTLRQIGRARSSGPDEVPAAVHNLEQELARARRQLVGAHARIGALLGAKLIEAATEQGWVIATLDDAPVDLLRAVAARVTSEPRLVAMLASRGGGWQHVVVSRGREAELHCGRLLGKVAALTAGQGGGRADHAEGRLPADASWRAAIERALGEP